MMCSRRQNYLVNNDKVIIIDGEGKDCHVGIGTKR